MKKKLPVIAIVAVLLVLIGVFVYSRLKADSSQPEAEGKKVKIAEKYNDVPIEERPYVSLKPTTESGKRPGTSLDMTVYELKKSATKAEYEIEYQSGTLLQGAFGRLNPGKLPDEQTIFLGSCSAGGKCSYHEEVSGGAIILRFEGDSEFNLKNEWSYIENADKGELLSSRDAKFSVSGAGITRVTHAVILVPPGFPENPTSKVLSLPYSVGTLQPVTGTVEVRIRLNEEAAQATILGWDGEAWVEMKTTVSERVAAATGPLYESYVAVAAEAELAE